MMQTLQISKSLVRVGLLETLRRKDLYVVMILTAILCFGAWTFNFFGINGLELFIKDVAFTAVGIMSTIVAVMIAGRQMPEEIQRKTIYPLLARPITRWQLLFGKWLSAFLTSSLVFAILATVALITFALFGLSIPPIQFQYFILKIVGIGWLTAMTIGLSIYLTPSANITICLILAFGSGMLSRLVLLLHADSAISSFLTNIVYGIFPHYDYFDLGAKVTYGWPMIPWWVIGTLTVYATLSGLLWLGFGWLKFRKQAV